MTVMIDTPWHKASYDRFIHESLPRLLSERVPLMGYAVDNTGQYTCQVRIEVGSKGHTVKVSYDLPQPDNDGLFRIGEIDKVVVPFASEPNLAKASILCVGEQLYQYIDSQMGKISADLPWDTQLAYAWFPLNTWVNAFFEGVGDRFVSAQTADKTNWLALRTHLRRLIIPELDEVIGPGQLGFVCPFETPEGPNIGHVLTIAVGAEIKDGKLVITDDTPAGTLGICASMVPLLEHNDPNRLLMGVNMMRQWIPQQTIEPAWVQSGNEPDAQLSPEFWTGRNLLTAYISWGNGTYEDGIIISESCAQRFDTPYGLKVGDKLSNRHGTKGLVSQILPDEEMPHLADGTPVELVCNFIKQHRRMNIGQVREAVLGRIAHRSDVPKISPPFGAPDSDELHLLCQKAGIPESGMENLTLGKHGPALTYPSTVGYVYWGRLFHLAKNKLTVFVDAERRQGQRIGEMETYMLRDLGAYENIRESLGIKSVRHPAVQTLSTGITTGNIPESTIPTPLFSDLTQRLRIAGIEATLENASLTFNFLTPKGTGITLARPLPHPWYPGQSLQEIGIANVEEIKALDSDLAPHLSMVIEANDRLAKMLSEQTPQMLVDDAAVHLENRLQAFFDALLTHVHLRMGERVLFSARSVLVPSMGLTMDQLGIPEQMAWKLFAPQVARELRGDTTAVNHRDDIALQTLDAVMSRSWVILNRAPTFEPTALLSFHPVRMPDDALHLHPLVCEWLSADFDGDQAAVFLPLTDEAQREAEHRLSVAAHLSRDPGLLSSLMPNLDMLWGLTYSSLDAAELAKINLIVGEPVFSSSGELTRHSLEKAVAGVWVRDGVNGVLDVLEQLMQLGFEGAKASGASFSPFWGEHVPLPPSPNNLQADHWSRYKETVLELMRASNDIHSPDIGPQLLMFKAEERASESMLRLVTAFGPVLDASNQKVIIHNNYVQGLTPDDMFATVAGARQGIKRLHNEWARMGSTFHERNVTRSLNTISRALRAKHPGVVFASAAANGQVDPLTDVESRLLVGLPVS